MDEVLRHAHDGSKEQESQTPCPGSVRHTGGTAGGPAGSPGAVLGRRRPPGAGVLRTALDGAAILRAGSALSSQSRRGAFRAVSGPPLPPRWWPARRGGPGGRPSCSLFPRDLRVRVPHGVWSASFSVAQGREHSSGPCPHPARLAGMCPGKRGSP